LAALLLDRRRLIDLIAGLDQRGKLDITALDAIVGHGLERLRQGQFPGLAWLVGLLDDAVLRAGLSVSAELMLFRKSLLTLEGVLADLTHEEFHVDDVLAADLASQFASELPARWWARFDSRQFGTRISNRDLAHLAWTWPLAAARYLRGGAA
jgi:hypothetical protein